jgi:hypothetical protein
LDEDIHEGDALRGGFLPRANEAGLVDYGVAEELFLESGFNSQD